MTGSFDLTFLVQLLRPIARLALRHSVRIRELEVALKQALVAEATAALRVHNTKVNTSRLSVLTGMQRKEIDRIMETSSEIPRGNRSLVARIVGQWQDDPRFSSRPGSPRTLTWEGDRSEFRKLVFSVSSDVHPGTVLFELERLGLIRRTPRGITLRARALNVSGDTKETLSLLADDVHDLFGAVTENLSGQETKGLPHLHARTEYDNVPASYAVRLRKLLLQEGRRVHSRARRMLSKFDRDIGPQVKGERETVRVCLSTFSYIEPVREEERDDA